MNKNYISSKTAGDYTLIECEDLDITVATNILQGIGKYTDNMEEAVDLYAYFTGRMARYNETLETTDDQETPKGNLTPIIIQNILVSLLQTETYDFIINCLEDVKDYDLFSSPALLEDVSVEDIIEYLISIIKDSYEISYSMEDDNLNNHYDVWQRVDEAEEPLTDIDENSISYEEKIRAAIAIGLPTMKTEEAKQLGLNPIC